MKYRVGDKVRVRQLEDINKIYKIDQNDRDGMVLLRSYEPYCGNTYKVKEIRGFYYDLEDEDGQLVSGFFTEEMLEDVKENKMKYKVGDKVRVRQWDDMVKEFGYDGVDIYIDNYYFVEEMKQYCGKTYEVCNADWFCYNLKNENEVLDWSFTDGMLEDVNSLQIHADSLTLETENMIFELKDSKIIVKPKTQKESEKKMKKQMTQRERLEGQLKEYQRDSGINSIEIIIPGKIVKVTMDDYYINSTCIMKCREDDTFSLEKAIIIAYVKSNRGYFLTPDGIEYEAERFTHFKDNMKKLKKAMKVYEIQQKLKALDEEEERIRANKKRKKIAQKKRRAERLAEEKLKETKEAAKIYAEALKSALCGYEISEDTVENMTKDMNVRV